MWDLTLRVSDCEELVGYLMEHQEEMRLTTLCIDGRTGCWLAGEPKDQLPILSGGPLFGGGPIIIFESVKRYILLQLLFLHLYNHHSHL